MSANSPAYPPYERMRTGLCLAAVGGFLEAYTYTLKGGVFANAQTGNLVLFALRLTQAQWAAALEAAAPIAAFFLGILLTERLKRLPARRGLFQWHCIAVCGECALLFASLVPGFPARFRHHLGRLVRLFHPIRQLPGKHTAGLSPPPSAPATCAAPACSSPACLYDHDKPAPPRRSALRRGDRRVPARRRHRRPFAAGSSASPPCSCAAPCFWPSSRRSSSRPSMTPNPPPAPPPNKNRKIKSPSGETARPPEKASFFMHPPMPARAPRRRAPSLPPA